MQTFADGTCICPPCGIFKRVRQENKGGCNVCGVDDNYDAILLCDGCDSEFHMHCLTPPLARIPKGDWFCVYCRNANDADPVTCARTCFVALYVLARAYPFVQWIVPALPSPPFLPKLLISSVRHKHQRIYR